MHSENHSITPEKAIEILREHDTIVTIEEAKTILNFMYKFTNLAINQLVNVNNHDPKGNEIFKSPNKISR